MNRMDKKIVSRLVRGGLKNVVAYDPWDDADRDIAGTIMTRPFDYTKKGVIVIIEHEERS